MKTLGMRSCMGITIITDRIPIGNISLRRRQSGFPRFSGPAARALRRGPTLNPHVPLAWLQLTKSGGRLTAAIAGVTFTVVFSLVQLAFQDALYRSVVLLYSHLQADLVLISPRYQCVVATDAFPERRLYQALAVDGVQSASPLYLGVMPWKNPVSHEDRQIMVVGFPPASNVLDLPEVNTLVNRLKEPGKVLFDEGSRPEFGPVADLLRSHHPVITELAGQKVQTIGLFRVGANFADDGNVVTSDTTFFQLQPGRKPGNVDVGILRLRPGADLNQTRGAVAAVLPRDVTVLTRAQFLEREQTFFGSSLPVGFFFGTSVLVGLIVGAVIVYQILYSDVTEHLPEYATVKAVGYPDRYLFGVVLRESLILSALGFPPGVLLSWIVYQIAQSVTLLPIRMTFSQLAIVYLLTAAMCALAGILAVQRLRRADPVEVF